MNESIREALKSLMGGISAAKKKENPDDGTPSGITRYNIDEVRKAGCEIATMAIAQTEYPIDNDAANKIIHDLSNELRKHAAGLGKPGEPMDWRAVREELIGHFTLLAHALTPQGIEARLVRLGLKPADTFPTDPKAPTPVDSNGPHFRDQFRPSKN